MLACWPWQTITSVIIDRDTSSPRVERKKWMMSEGSTMPRGSFLKMPTLPGSLPSLPASTHHTVLAVIIITCNIITMETIWKSWTTMNLPWKTLKTWLWLRGAGRGWSGLRGAMQKMMIFRDKQSDRNTLHQNIYHHHPDHNWSSPIAKITSLCRVTRYDHHCPNLYDKRLHHLWTT